jgi:hypothetical protein
LGVPDSLLLLLAELLFGPEFPLDELGLGEFDGWPTELEGLLAD